MPPKTTRVITQVYDAIAARLAGEPGTGYCVACLGQGSSVSRQTIAEAGATTRGNGPVRAATRFVLGVS